MSMTSDVQRQEREPRQRRCCRTSNPMRNQYRPNRANTNGRILADYATPHQAGTRPVRAEAKNRVIESKDRPANRRSTSAPKLVSRRESLARAAEIW